MNSELNSDYFVKVSNIVIPPWMYFPYKTDNQSLNNIFSDLGGIIPSQVIFLTGTPGSGKTTLTAYIASHVSDYILNNKEEHDRPHGKVVLISREMSDFQIKLLEHKVANFSDIILVRDKAPIDKMSEWMGDILLMKPSLIILDSLQQLAKDMMKTLKVNITDAINTILELFIEIARDTHTPVIFIGHVTKSGEFKGSNDIQHDIDTHIHLEVDKITKERNIVLKKNRFGNVSSEAVMKFEENSITIYSDLSTGDSEDKTIEEVIEYFHQQNKNRKFISQSSVELLFNLILKEFKIKYKEEFELQSKNIDSIRILYTQGKKTYTDTVKNIIYIGMNDLRTIDDYSASPYIEENNYMNNICKNKEDKTIWKFIHEFTTLLCPTNKTQTYFQKVYKIAKDNLYLFSK